MEHVPTRTLAADHGTRRRQRWLVIALLVFGIAAPLCADEEPVPPAAETPPAAEPDDQEASDGAPIADETPPADEPASEDEPSSDGTPETAGDSPAEDEAPVEDEPASEDATTIETEDEGQQQYEREQLESGEVRAGTFSPDDINVVLREGWEPVKGLFRIDPIVEPWVRFSDYLRWTARLDLGIAYTAVFQSATAGRSPRNAAGGDFDLFGTWHLIGLEGDNAGRLGFSWEFRHDFGGIPPSELNESIGSLLKTTDGFNTRDFTLKQLWWQQELLEGDAFFRAGLISQSDFFATGPFQSANFFFLNEAFASSLAVPFPGTGPGIAAFIYPNEHLYVGAGVGLADTNDDASFFELLDKGELFGAVEVAIVDPFPELGPGKYRLTFSHSDGVEDENKPAGDTISISLDQRIGRFVPFFKYSIANTSGLTQIRQIATGGVGVFDPLGNQGDFLGLAFAWSNPDNTNLRDEYVIEAFYRIQLTPSVQLTPDVQLIIDPAFNGEDDLVAVFGLRFRIQY